MADPVIRTSLWGRRVGISDQNELIALNPLTNRHERIAGPNLLGGLKNGSAVAQETQLLAPRYEILTCTALSISIADDAGVAQYGGVKVFDFPEGLIEVGPCIVSGTLTAVAPTIDTFAGGVA